MQSLIAVIFKEDMDRAEAYRVELRGREELAGLVDCSKMVAAVCDKEGKVHLQYTHALAKDGALNPGSSALFIPLKKEAVDETLRALGNSDGVVLSTDLKLEDEYQMEKLFEEMTAERAKKTS